MIKIIVLIINVLILLNFLYCIILMIKNRQIKTKDKSFIVADNISDDLYIIKSNNIISNYYDTTRKTIKLSNNIYNDNSIYSNFITSYICDSSNISYKFINFINKFITLLIYSNLIIYILILLSIFSNSLELMITSIICFSIFLILDIITMDEKDKMIDKLNIDKKNLYHIKFYYSNIMCHSVLESYLKIK